MRVRFTSLLIALAMLLSSAAAAGERGLLWRIQPPQGAPSYLFGTIHTHDERVTGFSPRLVEAIGAVDVFMPEAMPPDTPARIFMIQGTLKDLLAPQEVEVLLTLADRYALRESVALHMKPWMLAVLLAQPAVSGMPPQDLLLKEIAQVRGRQVEALESSEAHFTAMDGLEMADQLALLRAAMQQSQEEKAQAFETLVNAYLTRDMENIAMLDAQLSAAGLPAGLWPKMRKLLIDDRNARMAERLLEKMPQATLFVAVGAAHLPGPGGLIARLRSAGYRVEAVE